ncbi:hypothetical protein FHG87_006327 [Trinorchestia longiramus]|nr:hypothetical protein FHG87_006327 [Trinorchestia longiramus]
MLHSPELPATIKLSTSTESSAAVDACVLSYEYWTIKARVTIVRSPDVSSSVSSASSPDVSSSVSSASSPDVSSSVSSASSPDVSSSVSSASSPDVSSSVSCASSPDVSSSVSRVSSPDVSSSDGSWTSRAVYFLSLALYCRNWDLFLVLICLKSLF